ncbi:MAG: ATPase [Oscillospiraceae bacterium]|nr:ATPase [Oscillospiraceae bacterium]
MDTITAEQLNALPRDGYIMVDVKEIHDDLPPKRDVGDNIPYILYCRRGEISAKIAEEWREKGYNAVHLEGGYAQWVLSRVQVDNRVKIEESIRKKFHKQIFSKFTKAIKAYQLVQEGDHIAVCISGGKDSMLMAKLLQELQRHRQVSFSLTFLVMDPGYAPENRALIERNAANLGVPIEVFETDIFDSVANVEKSPCYLCARMRRGHLYAEAQNRGCNKIALGHHYDDVIETILMGMLYGSQVQTMMPKLKSKNFEDMELIRPMYLVRERDIKHFQRYHDLHFLQCACRLTDSCSLDGAMFSKRTEIKQLIQELKKTNPDVECNIFNSVENVHLGSIISYKRKDGEVVHFLDDY